MSETTGSPDDPSSSLLFPWLAQPLSTWWGDVEEKKTEDKDDKKTDDSKSLTSAVQKKTRSNPHGFRHRGQFGAIQRGPRPRKVTLKTLRRFMSAVDHGDFLPIYMNWADMDNVIKVRFGGQKPPGVEAFVPTPVDQGSCGNCYAISSTNMTRSRFAVWDLKNVPDIDPLEATICLPNSLRCNAGDPNEVFHYFRDVGADPGSAFQDEVGSEGLDAKVVAQEDPPKHTPKICSIRGRYFCIGIGTSSESHTLSTINQIKHSIYHNGPIVAMFKTWDDFNSPMVAPGMHCWPETNNIYIRGSYVSRATTDLNGFLRHYQDSLNINPMSSPQVQSLEEQFQGSTGLVWSEYWKEAHARIGHETPKPGDPIIGHAVVIVGWGSDSTVPGMKGVPIGYWICQNSWGPDWNDKGYFKIAMTQQAADASLKLNEDVGIDIPAMQADGQPYGGVLSWHPAVPTEAGSKIYLDHPRLLPGQAPPGSTLPPNQVDNPALSDDKPLPPSTPLPKNYDPNDFEPIVPHKHDDHPDPPPSIPTSPTPPASPGTNPDKSPSYPVLPFFPPPSPEDQAPVSPSTPPPVIPPLPPGGDVPHEIPFSDYKAPPPTTDTTPPTASSDHSDKWMAIGVVGGILLLIGIGWWWTSTPSTPSMDTSPISDGILPTISVTPSLDGLPSSTPVSSPLPSALKF